MGASQSSKNPTSADGGRNVYIEARAGLGVTWKVAFGVDLRRRTREMIESYLVLYFKVVSVAHQKESWFFT